MAVDTLRAEVLTSDLTRDEARALTERIKAAIGDVRALVLEAFEREAWRPLGFASWPEYAQSEFGYSGTYTSDVLTQARVQRRLSAVVASIGGSYAYEPQPTAREARVLGRDLDAVADEYQSEVEAGADPAEAYEVVVARHQPPESEPVSRYTPMAEGVVLSGLKELRPGLRSAMASIARHAAAVPEAGRGEEGQIEEARRWIAAISAVTAEDSLRVLYLLRAELYEMLLTAKAETKDGLAHLSMLGPQSIDYWRSQLRKERLRQS